MTQTKPRRFSALIRIFIVFVVTFDLAFVGQKVSGAYESEFGAHPDEAAHCVTGLFVRDAMVEAWRYAAEGFQGSPIEVGRAFAENFYRHYPKVALGVWPPAFHTLQAVWTFPFGVSRTSLMLLMAALAAVAATLIFELVRAHCGLFAATIAAVVWLSGPLVREHTSLLMAEMLSAVAMFAATVMWARYLDAGNVRRAVGFALMASLAILTKATGLALLLMCGLTIVSSRRWRVLARPSLWLAALIVLVLAGTWTWFFRGEGARVGGWEANQFTWEFTLAAGPFYLKAAAYSVAFAVPVFALFGAILGGRKSSIALSLSCLVVAVLVFQALIPVGREARHILTVTPALIVLAVVGCREIARHSAMRVTDAAVQAHRERMWVVLLALCSLPQALLADESKSYEGFGPLAEEAVKVAPTGARILVSSDASGEGMFISEVALRDERPNLIIERGSKSLVDAKDRDWAGRNLKERFGDDASLLNYILRSKIDYVVLDAAVPDVKRVGYHDQLRRVIGDNAGTFWVVAESPVRRNGQDLFPPVRLYRVVRDLQPGAPAQPLR